MEVHNAAALKASPGFAVYEMEDADDALVGDLAQFALTNAIYATLVEGYATEISARRNAMDNASKNAGEMISKLWVQDNYEHAKTRLIRTRTTTGLLCLPSFLAYRQMQFNRQRQAVITNELVDIIVRGAHPAFWGARSLIQYLDSPDWCFCPISYLTLVREDVGGRLCRKARAMAKSNPNVFSTHIIFLIVTSILRLSRQSCTSAIRNADQSDSNQQLAHTSNHDEHGLSLTAVPNTKLHEEIRVCRLGMLTLAQRVRARKITHDVYDQYR